MSVKKEQAEKHRIYYCTFTCHKWLNLFEITKLHDHIYAWFDLMERQYRNQILGYVIMPNHLHLLLFVNEQSKTINQLIGNGKRFMPYYIHRNPVSGKWNLAESVIDYPHSSARFYETGEHSTYQVTAYSEAGVYEN